MEKIKDIIIKNLKEEEIYEEEIILKVIKKIERIPIKKTGFFSKFFYKRLDEGKIIYTNDLFNLTIPEANIIFKSGEPMIKYYVKEITNKIKEIIKRLETKKNKKYKANNLDKKLRIIIPNIKEDKTILDILRDEILYEEKYNDLSIEEKKTTKPFYYSALNLNNYELSILKMYLLETLEYKNEEKFFDAVINIYTSIQFFIKKLRYKSIIDNDYNSLNDINLTSSEIRTLNRMNITYVSELIEIGVIKEERHALKKFKKKATQALNEIDIIIPNNIEELSEELKKHNAIKR